MAADPQLNLAGHRGTVAEAAAAASTVAPGPRHRRQWPAGVATGAHLPLQAMALAEVGRKGAGVGAGVRSAADAGVGVRVVEVVLVHRAPKIASDDAGRAAPSWHKPAPPALHVSTGATAVGRWLRCARSMVRGMCAALLECRCEGAPASLLCVRSGPFRQLPPRACMLTMIRCGASFTGRGCACVSDQCWQPHPICAHGCGNALRSPAVVAGGRAVHAGMEGACIDAAETF